MTGIHFFGVKGVVVISSGGGMFKNLGLLSGSSPQFSPFVGHPDLSIERALRRVFGLLSVMILKIMSESIFPQSIINSM